MQTPDNATGRLTQGRGNNLGDQLGVDHPDQLTAGESVLLLGSFLTLAASLVSLAAI